MSRPKAPTAVYSALSKRDVSAATGLTLAAIDTMVRSGCPSTPGASARAGLTFDLPEVVKWMVAQGAGADDTTIAAKRRLALAQAAKLEAANDRESGRYVDLEVVRAEVADGIAKLRDALLAIAPRLVGESEATRAAVLAEIVSAINVFSVEAST